MTRKIPNGKRRTLTAVTVASAKPRKQRYEISDMTKGLRLVVEPSGSKRWTFRFRRPNGKSADMRLGSVDVTGGGKQDGHRQRIKYLEAEVEQLRKLLLECGQKLPETPPVSRKPKIGDMLTLAAARELAAEQERLRSEDGIDPAARKQSEKRQRRIVTAERESNLFPAAVRLFCDKYTVDGQKPRSWRMTARHLGLDYPAKGGEPVLVEKGLAQRWAKRSLADITPDEISDVVNEALERGIPGMGMRTEGESDARARKMRDALGGMFGWFHKKQRDPRQRIAVDPTVGCWRPDSPKSRDRTLNFDLKTRRGDEVRWFWTACDKIGEPYTAALKLLLVTGQRLREIAAMKFDELNDDFSELTLPAERTKNNREHIVPLPPLAQSILASLPRIENCPFVLSANGRTSGGSWNRIKAKLDKEMLDEAKKEAKKEHRDDATIKPFVLHDLRRTVSTGMAAIGVLPHVVEAVLNHQSGTKAGVAGVYNKFTYRTEKREALESWALHIQKIVSGGKVVDLDSRRA